MGREVDIAVFLELSKSTPFIDVRSENEFLCGHIPGACNVPILDNEQRKIVGTLYKQVGREVAILKGLELLGPRMSERLKMGVKISGNSAVMVHCWRGGMRSQFYAFLLQFYGLQPVLLKGGYKSFRKVVHEKFKHTFDLVVLGGKTGSGKTNVLLELAEKGQQVIDLEALANHRGSAFGGLGMTEQPTQEQFENNLYAALAACDSSRKIWVEDESRTIGRIVIPEAFWMQMRTAPVLLLQRDVEERLDQIMQDYSGFRTAELIESLERIGKRLGPQHVKRAVEWMHAGNSREAFSIALHYYDKAYQYNLEKSKTRKRILHEGSGKSYADLAEEMSNLKWK
jgi:tRNA 2-selenouridine synthase